jgi:alkylhydroperoxidase family enzyme
MLLEMISSPSRLGDIAWKGKGEPQHSELSLKTSRWLLGFPWPYGFSSQTRHVQAERGSLTCRRRPERSLAETPRRRLRCPAGGKQAWRQSPNPLNQPQGATCASSDRALRSDNLTKFLLALQVCGRSTRSSFLSCLQICRTQRTVLENTADSRCLPHSDQICFPLTKMRIPYTDNPPKNLSPDEQEVLKRVQARRGPMGLIPLDLALLHSPPVADGWNALLGAVRTKTDLYPDIREIAICRVARINEAWFEWDAHLPILANSLEREGNVAEKLVKMEELNPTDKGPLSDSQWAVLRYADAMTKDVKVSDETFHALKDVGLNDKEIIELTATVASYNMVSRFLVALDVGEKNGKGPQVIL